MGRGLLPYFVFLIFVFQNKTKQKFLSFCHVNILRSSYFDYRVCGDEKNENIKY